MLNGRLARWMAQEVEDGIADVVPEAARGPGQQAGRALGAALWRWPTPPAGCGRRWPAARCERIESATGLPGEDEAAEARIDGALSNWGAQEPVWGED